jgi:hypothetical protein
MSIMFCGYFNVDLWKIFIELSYFYKEICAKEVSKVMMHKLEKEISLLVRWKKVLPLGWFNVMQDLLLTTALVL